jgi:hypothetical protein
VRRPSFPTRSVDQSREFAELATAVRGTVEILVKAGIYRPGGTLAMMGTLGRIVGVDVKAPYSWPDTCPRQG